MGWVSNPFDGAPIYAFQQSDETSPGIKIFVDPVNGANTNNGLSWGTAVQTITAGIALVVTQRGDTVYLGPDYAGGAITAITETVTTAKSGFAIVGAQPEKDWPLHPYWMSAQAGDIAFHTTGYGVSLRNLNFEAQNNAVAVQFERTAGAVEAKANQIINCRFAGGIYGVDLRGSPDNVLIKDTLFEFITDGGGNGFCIIASATAVANPFRTRIINCVFQECDNYIDLPSNGGILRFNHFAGTGHTLSAASKIDFTNGNDNSLAFNWFGGDYSTAASSYVPGTGDSWIGNLAEDTAEPEVDSTGWTTDIPKA